MCQISPKWIKMKRSYFTREITYTDDCDFITGDPEGKEEKQ